MVYSTINTILSSAHIASFQISQFQFLCETSLYFVLPAFIDV